MPNVDVTRLNGLIDRIAPLTRIQRGEVIRARDWNDVAGALVDLARVLLAFQEDGSIPPHEHPDQVKLSWLDGGLRDRFERGPLSDPGLTGRLFDVERGVQRLGGELERSGKETAEVRDRLTAIATRDAQRAGELSELARVVEVLGQRRDDVSDLRTALGSIQREVVRAVDLASRLTIDGRPFDAALFEDRLTAVEQLRVRLRGRDGALLDAPAVEARFDQVERSMLTPAKLEEALRDRTAHLSEEDTAALRESVRASVRADVDSAVGQLRAQVQTDVDARLTQVDASIARALADALPQEREVTLALTRGELAAATKKGLEDCLAETERRLNLTTEALRAEIASAARETLTSVGGAVESQVQKLLEKDLESLRALAVQALARATSAEDRLADHDKAIQELGLRIETVSREDAAGRGELKQGLLAEMQQRDEARLAATKAMLAQADADNQTRIASGIATLRGELLDRMRDAAATAAAAEVRSAETRLRAEMASIAADQIAGTRDELRKFVTTTVDQALQRLPGMVSLEVRNATATLGEQVKREVNALRPTLEALVDRRIERLRPR